MQLSDYDTGTGQVRAPFYWTRTTITDVEKYLKIGRGTVVAYTRDRVIRTGKIVGTRVRGVSFDAADGRFRTEYSEYVGPLPPPPTGSERTLDGRTSAVWSIENRGAGKREFPNEFIRNRNPWGGRKERRPPTNKTQWICIVFFFF